MPKTLPIITSTQQHLDIEDVSEDLALLKDGGAALVMQTTAVNFGLLSETEQDATIYAYANLLNSLTFPIQIVIRSKRMDISAYLKLLKQQEEKQTSEGLRFQIKKYRQFVESIIKENRVLDKRFYIVIPFSPLELGAKSASTSLIGLLNPFAKKGGGGLPFPKAYILERAKNNLYPKRDHVAKQLARIGLKAEQLTTQELVELFYDIYNPVQAGGERLTAQASDYTTPLVTPATEEPLETKKEPPQEKEGKEKKPPPSPGSPPTLTGTQAKPPAPEKPKPPEKPRTVAPGAVNQAIRSVSPPPAKTTPTKPAEKPKTETEQTLYQADQDQEKLKPSS